MSSRSPASALRTVEPMRAIAVDWSGATHTARSHIWLAEAVHPRARTSLEAGRASDVDWPGATHTARSHIWLAEAVHPGELKSLEAGRDRDELATHLLSLQK